MRPRLLPLLWLLCVGLVLPALAGAQQPLLRASVDRTQIRVNESFTYVLRGEGQFSGRFDPSALARDFDILETSQRSQVSIGFGSSTQVIEWVVALMPRKAGRFELPPVTINGVQSNALEIEILPALAASGAGDIFIEVEIDRPVSYVQAQTIFTLRLFVGIGTGRATLTAPAIDGGEAIVEKLGDDRQYQTVRNNREYDVHERQYVVFPQTPGNLRIGPAIYEAVVNPSRGVQRQFRLSSEIVELEVRPAVAPPASHPSAVWLPASALRIEESWSDSNTVFEQGVPKTRALTVIATGVLETQLPGLSFAASPGLRQYVDQPEFSREFSADGIEARRTERYAVIAQQPGSVELPPLELPWWNVTTERWEIARLPGAAIDVLPGADAAPLPAATASESQTDRTDAAGPGFWPWLSGALALGWIATLAAWWLRARSVSDRAPRSAAAPSISAKSLDRQIRAACRVNDSHRCQELLLLWARLHFPDDPPTSLGALASRLSGALAAEVAGLEVALYGQHAGGWQGARLLEALEAAPAPAASASAQEPDPLAPLYR